MNKKNKDFMLRMFVAIIIGIGIWYGILWLTLKEEAEEETEEEAEEETEEEAEEETEEEAEEETEEEEELNVYRMEQSLKDIWHRIILPADEFTYDSTSNTVEAMVVPYDIYESTLSSNIEGNDKVAQCRTKAGEDKREAFMFIDTHDPGYDLLTDVYGSQTNLCIIFDTPGLTSLHAIPDRVSNAGVSVNSGCTNNELNIIETSCRT